MRTLLIITLFSGCSWAQTYRSLVEIASCGGTDKVAGISATGLINCEPDDAGVGGGLPSGLITISLTTCPSGFTEVTALNGVTLVGTLAANGDVGDPIGDDTITPAGTVSTPTF